MYTTAPALLSRVANPAFWGSYFQYSDPLDGLVYRKESTQLTEQYAGTGAAPMPEQWEADDNVKVVPVFDYSATNKFWRNSVRLHKALIRFQQWDVVARIVGSLGNKARSHQVARLSAFLNGAHATAGADGQLFFDTDHVWPGADYATVWDNDLTANVTDPLAPTLANLQAAIRAIIAALWAQRDDRGDPFMPSVYNPNDVVIMYPQAGNYMNVIHQLLTQDSITNPGDNDLKGRFVPVMNPFLTTPSASSGVIYGFYRGTADRKPLILQINGDVEFSDNLMGDEYRSTGNAVYSATWVGEAAPGDHTTAVRYEFT